MDKKDHRSSALPDTNINVDLSPIYDAIERRKWLLDEQYIGYRPGFDELIHDSLCNLSPEYQKGKTAEEIAQLKINGCDRYCLKAWKDQQRLLSIKLADSQ